MTVAKAFLRGLKKELAETDPVVKEKALKVLPWIIAANILIWTGFGIAGAIMLVSLGGWPWVVWPFAFYWWTHHVGRKLAVYQKAKKGEQKWEQNVTFNVSSDLTEEQIAAAVERAVNVDLQYGR